MAKRLNVPALGIAIGVLWGVCVLLMTWLNAVTGGLARPPEGPGWFWAVVKGLQSIYPWYGPGFWGGIWGGICAFIDGLICGGVIAWIYNRLATPVE